MQLQLRGKASGKTQIFELEAKDLEKSVLDFLRERGTPMASSCNGRQQCNKCLFNTNKLGCATTIAELRHEKPPLYIEIDYL